MTQTQTVAHEIATQTQDAYSFHRYGFAAWRACCALLTRRGYSAEQVETLMRSTLTRYAADDAIGYYRATSAHLARLLDQPSTTQYIADLFEETAPTPVPSRQALTLVWSR